MSKSNLIEYDVEFMGEDGKDMYEMTVLASDIEDAYRLALKKKDLPTDRIVCVCEVM